MTLADWIHAVLLALIQGLTEFLPISSSAHLILPSHVLGWPDQGLAFDVSVHVGTLIAVLIYFRVEVYRIGIAWLNTLRGRSSREGTLGWLVILATIPAVIAGKLLEHQVEGAGRSILVIATTTILFGLLLGWADAKCRGERQIAGLGVRDAILIGLAQAVALIPGTSRSGITITAALMLGFDRQSAARFSFLLSIPVILGAGTLKTVEMVKTGTDAQWEMISIGVVLSAVSALACIWLFLKWLDRIGMMPFVVYRLLLGLALFGVLFAR